MKKFLLAVMLTVFAAAAFPQGMSGEVYVVDETDGGIVPYARITNEKGVTIGFTDEHGAFPGKDIGEGKITVQHLAYLPKEVKGSQLGDGTLIRLTPRNYVLGEVKITPKDNDYIHLRTYFRSYQLNDSCLKYFKDGFADFFIKLKGKKVKRVVSQARLLGNEALMSRDKKRANMLVDKYITTPYLEKSTLLEGLKEDGCVCQPDSAALAFLYRDGAKVGVIKEDTVNGVCAVTYDALENKGEKKGSLFGYTTRLVYNYQTEVYKDASEYKSYIDLICKRGYRKLFYNHKKDPEEQMVEVVDELYVLRGECVSSGEMEEMLSRLRSAESEESVEGLDVPPLDAHLSFVLKTEMVPME